MTRRKIRLNAEWPGGSDEQLVDLPDGWDTWPRDAREEFLADNAVEFLASSGCGSGGCVVEVDEHDNEIRIIDDEDRPPMTDRRHAIIFNAISRGLSERNRFAALSDREHTARLVGEALDAEQPDPRPTVVDPDASAAAVIPARRALGACLDGDDQHAAELLNGLDDAALYAIVSAGSALAVHASRLRKDPDEQAAQAAEDEACNNPCCPCTNPARPDDDGHDPLAAARDLTEDGNERLVALLARRDADNARRWEQADAEMTAMRQRAETAERSAAAWQADARRFDENSDHWRKRADEASQERDTAREALDAAGIVIASLRDQRDEQRQRAEVAERERDEARSAHEASTERLLRQLGDATRRADEQKARAQRAEAEAADWRTTARQADGRLVKLRRLANQQDYVRAADILAILHQDATETLHNIIGEDPDKFRSWLRDEIRRDPEWWRGILARELRLGWLREDFRRAGLGD